MKALVKVFTAIVLVGVMGLVSCQQSEKATIYLKVVNSGNPVPEVAVGMYQLVNIADTIQPHGRYNSVVTTDNEGVAEFVISRMDIGENGVFNTTIKNFVKLTDKNSDKKINKEQKGKNILN